MITIYTSPSCSSCRKVKKWFEEQHIPYKEKNIFASTLTEQELKDMLIKAENGTDDIISNRSKIIKEQKVDIESMKISELVSFIRENPTILKRPIMLDDRRMQVGYNSEEIRTFIPRAQRIAEMNCPHPDYCCEEGDECDEE